MKNYKLFFICAMLFFLDVAVLPRVCTPKVVHEEKVLFIFETANAEEITFTQTNPITTSLRVGDTVSLQEFHELLDYFLESTDIIYSQKESDNSYGSDYIYLDAKLNSYSIANVYLCGEQHDYKQIEIPYQLKDGDFSIYYQGMRNLLIFKVSLDIEYELIEKGA